MQVCPIVIDLICMGNEKDSHGNQPKHQSVIKRLTKLIDHLDLSITPLH